MREPVAIENRVKRADLVRRGRYLEYFTIGYNSLEGVIAVVAGLIAGSIALVGFGFDSLIEVTSGSVLLWRLYADVDEERRKRVERGVRGAPGRVPRGMLVFRRLTQRVSHTSSMPAGSPVSVRP